ncbi:hypothetical protein [Pleurocapsa sp. FMAR1]|uniref:hypothetical protein n=1 Tax=Pleurocapsa sp. FMAR1 TaxID=3040204 RepID=UPI0029C8DB4F|nr:hypothetical protein [Pleurocapsa sp. FMAR1]
MTQSTVKSLNYVNFTTGFARGFWDYKIVANNRAISLVGMKHESRNATQKHTLLLQSFGMNYTSNCKFLKAQSLRAFFNAILV